MYLYSAGTAPFFTRGSLFLTMRSTMAFICFDFLFNSCTRSKLD